MADEKILKDAAEKAEAAVESAGDTAKKAVEAAEEKAEEIKDAAEEKIEDVKDAVEEKAEEIADEVKETSEEIKDAVEEKIDDIKDAAGEQVSSEQTAPESEMSEVDKAVAAAMAERDMQEAKLKAQKSKKAKIIAVIAAAVVVIGGVVASGFASRGADGGIRFNTYNGWLPKAVNKYNHMGYVDITGNTVGDLAASMGVDVPDFLDQFGLPADMPASTYEMAAVYMLPVKSYGSMYGLDFATMKDILHIPDTTEDGEEITEDSLWGVVQGEISVGDYVGDTGDGAALSQFKEEFGFGDEVTAETKWKEVRDTVDKANRDQRLASEKASESADTSNDADVPADDGAAPEEAPADDAAAVDDGAAPEEAPADDAAVDEGAAPEEAPAE